jgi:hypothetical protein
MFTFTCNPTPKLSQWTSWKKPFLVSCVNCVPLRDSDNTVGIERLHGVHTCIALITSERERFKQTVVEWISALLTLFYFGLLAMREPGDLFRQQLVPNFPTQPRSELLSDSRLTAAIFPLDRDNPDYAFLND